MRDRFFSDWPIVLPVKFILAILLFAVLTQKTTAAPIIFQSDFTKSVKPVYKIKKLSLIPDNFRISQKKSLLGKLYIKLQKIHDKEKARQVTNAIEELWLTSGSDDIDSLMNGVMNAIEDKKHDKAIHVLDKIIQINPSFTEAWNKRAMVYFLKKDYYNSMINLQTVLTLDSRHFQAINGMAIILQETGHKKAALKTYRQLLEINPHLQSAISAVKTLKRDVEGQET